MALPALEREARPSGVMMIPVPRSGTLRAIRGQTDAARVPGIDAVQVTVALDKRWSRGRRVRVTWASSSPTVIRRRWWRRRCALPIKRSSL